MNEKQNDKKSGEIFEEQKSGEMEMRQEGEYWNAYYIANNDSILIGSILASTLSGNDARKNEFVNLMLAVTADSIETAMGVRPRWREELDD